jgi:UTP--glucose-1-phosphate uridylyltransferase
LKKALEEHDGILGLPLIRNEKTVDPRDETSPVVYQLETAMGSAISVFSDAAVMRVPRSRFAPVKTTDDLLAVRSDAYILGDDMRLVVNPERTLEKLVVELDPEHYRLIDDFNKRFPEGPPSLRGCESLSVHGDIRFGCGVVLRGRVELNNDSGEQRVIPDGEVIEGATC